MDWLRKTFGFSSETSSDQKAPELAKSPVDNGFVFIPEEVEPSDEGVKKEEVNQLPVFEKNLEITENKKEENNLQFEVEVGETIKEPFMSYDENEPTFVEKYIPPLSDNIEDIPDLVDYSSSDDDLLLIPKDGKAVAREFQNLNSRWELCEIGDDDIDTFGESYIQDLFGDVFQRDQNEAMKLLFFVRDPRHGNGNRRVFKICVRWLINSGYTQLVNNNLEKIAEHGSYKDYWFLMDTPLKYQIIRIFAKQLKADLENLSKDENSEVTHSGISLCAKWAPTEGKKIDKKYKAVSLLASDLGVTKSEYRKNYLRPLRNYLEKCERIKEFQKDLENERNGDLEGFIDINRFKQVFQDKSYHNYRYNIFKINEKYFS